MIVAKFGNGDVLITPVLNVGEENVKTGYIVFQNGKGTGKVGGEKSTEDFAVNKEDIILSFRNKDSIDVVIRRLEQLKRMMEGKEEGLIASCELNIE